MNSFAECVGLTLGRAGVCVHHIICAFLNRISGFACSGTVVSVVAYWMMAHFLPLPGRKLPQFHTLNIYQEVPFSPKKNLSHSTGNGLETVEPGPRISSFSAHSYL